MQNLVVNRDLAYVRPKYYMPLRPEAEPHALEPGLCVLRPRGGGSGMGSISSGVLIIVRLIEELLTVLEPADTLIVTDLSRLGRCTADVIALVNTLIQRSIRLIGIKQGLDVEQHNMQSKIVVTLFSLFGELERDLLSLRTREALAAKKLQGVRLGKPKGTIQKSKFDADRDRIQELLGLGLSVRKIAKLLGYSNHLALNTYIMKRKLRGPESRSES